MAEQNRSRSNSMPNQSRRNFDSRLDAPPAPLAYPNLHMRSDSHQTSNTPMNDATIIPRSNQEHPLPSPYLSFFHPSVQTASEHFRHLSSVYNEAWPSYRPPHVPHNVTDNRVTPKRKQREVPVGPIHTEHRPSESGTSGVARTRRSNPAEGRNVRIRQGDSFSLELNPPRRHVPHNVTDNHGTSWRNHCEVTVGPIHTEQCLSESGTSGAAGFWNSNTAEGYHRNVRSCHGHSPVPHNVTNNHGTSQRNHCEVPVGPIRTEHHPSESGTSGVAGTRSSNPTEGSDRNVRGHCSPWELNPPRKRLPQNVTDNHGTSKRKHYEVPVGSIHTEHCLSESGTNGVAGTSNSNSAERSERNVRIRRGHSSPLELYPPGHGSRDSSRYNDNGHHATNRVAHYDPVGMHEPNFLARNRNSSVPAASQQSTMAQAVGHASISFPPAAVHHGPIPTHVSRRLLEEMTEQSLRRGIASTESEASSSHSRPGIHVNIRLLEEIQEQNLRQSEASSSHSRPGIHVNLRLLAEIQEQNLRQSEASHSRPGIHVNIRLLEEIQEQNMRQSDASRPRIHVNTRLLQEIQELRQSEASTVTQDLDRESELIIAFAEGMGYMKTNRISKCFTESTCCTDGQDDRCVICMEDYKKGDKLAKLRWCTHIFHTTCIKKWLQMKKTCPLCKSKGF